ncbi:class I SAM-dependent methyltransferase [Geoalkalibacter halelectricus]|uniref:class I SAM-dependent methyltransferase n=1 Tax=Geoalkalibacter halelectricus TaxID=2847045 RepID=UPI003D2178AA
MLGLMNRKSQTRNESVEKVFDFFNHALTDPALPAFAVRLWEGSLWRSADQEPGFTLELRHPQALRSLFWRPTELSLGEAYIYGEIDVHGDFEACFALADYLVEKSWSTADILRLGGKFLRLGDRRPAGIGRGAPRLRGRAHSKTRDAQAVRYHYDVSNDFYRLWLDRRMVYSCAFFHTPDENLDEAQYRKLDYLCRKLRLKPGEKLLDIGCGWGALILHAAEKYGVEALGITLSPAQAELAEQRIRQADLSKRCQVQVMDYRDVSGPETFDKIVSVGMFEHVGETKLPEYFKKAHTLLKPGGVFLNHGITLSMTGQGKSDASFIDKYVFPDGDLLPISTSLRVAEESGFEIRDVECLREHYALTLRRWVQNLEAKREKAIALTNEVTYRIWKLYMSGSAHGFQTTRLGLYQSLLAKSGRRHSGLPLTRCDWFRPCPSGHF